MKFTLFSVTRNANAMKLLTKELEARFQKIGRQEDVSDPLVIAKFFHPLGAGTWYATEYFPDERIFFGYVSLFNDENDEWGYFSLEKLQMYRGPIGIGIERDLYFSEQRISQIDPRALRYRKMNNKR